MDDSNISCKVKDLGKFHIDSFNYAIDDGIKNICNDTDPIYIEDVIKISVSNASMKKLQYPMDLRRHKRTVYPSEASIRGITYYCELEVELCFEQDYKQHSKKNEIYFIRTFYVPVMLKSNLCYLNGLSLEELKNVKEDDNDPGGYFIVNGKERLIRQFVVPRRNYPLAIKKNSLKSYREGYSEYGIFIRSVKNEHMFSNISLHYLTDGSYEVRLYHNSTPHHIGVVLLLKCLVDINDFSICKEVSKFYKEFPQKNLMNMIHKLQNVNVCSHLEAKEYLGTFFHGVVNLPSSSSFVEVTDYVLRKFLLVHLDRVEDKFQFLCYSLCKLYCIVQNKCRLDDLDNPVYQEILAPGHVYMTAIKLGMSTYLKSVKNIVAKKINAETFLFKTDCIRKCCNTAISLSSKVTSVIATGNLLNKREHGFPSDTGYTIALKRTNVFQLAAQFTAVCKFSMEHYAKAQRTYYPESWGFLCPTQTPEGENTGLYNYLAAKCQFVKLNSSKIQVQSLFKLGVLPCDDPFVYTSREKFFLFLDGVIFGWMLKCNLNQFMLKLKNLRSKKIIPYHSEIILMIKEQHFFPGIYLFSSPCRFVRQFLVDHQVKFIGCFEQGMNTLCRNENDAFLSEWDQSQSQNFLSLSTAMIPFLENNPAVRNIFASGKCKQALGLPFYNLNGRSNSCTYQLIYTQIPVVSTKLYSESQFDLYPHGSDVIIAIISYSAFDMEDALVLNKASIQRGLFHNMVYKTHYYSLVDLATECGCKVTGDIELKRNEEDLGISNYLDRNGLPYIGRLVQQNEPILSIYCKKNKRWFIKLYNERHNAYVQFVRLMGDITSSISSLKNSEKISITFSLRRVPVVGDKFSHRHGGKGICSYLMNSEDLPFSEEGIVPDILFNPNGIPSRMCIGMLFEMIAAKATIYKGSKYIVEPFNVNKSSKTYKTIGEALKEIGFNYYGTEKFYSGTSGEELEADVFCGCMHYLRLHHVVEEKYQIRSLGAVDEKTNQPLNLGLSGAIRVGEMERDSLLAHGAMQITLDRLLFCSDKCIALLCSSCHTLLYPMLQNPNSEERFSNLISTRGEKDNKKCNICRKKSKVIKIRIPYVLIYLIAELSVFKIKLKFSET